MTRWIGLLLLGTGLALAAAFGARNGERHVAYRQAQAAVQAAERAEGVIEAGRRLNAQLRSEGIEVSPATMEEVLALIDGEPRLKAQVDASREAVEALRRWELAEGPPSEVLHVAERRRDAVGLPEPAERLQGWLEVGGLGWGLGLLLIVVGAVIARRDLAAKNAGVGAEAGGRVDFPRAVDAALVRLDALAARLAELPMDDEAPDARAAIDALQIEVLDPVVEGRGQLIARHGLARFAEYFGPFSGAERNLARAWSALTDGHAEVARSSVEASRAGFVEARAAWDVVEGGA